MSSAAFDQTLMYASATTGGRHKMPPVPVTFLFPQSVFILFFKSKGGPLIHTKAEDDVFIRFQ